MAFQEVFGSFKGGLTTNRHVAYNVHEGARQLCWSHADRDFEKIEGREEFDKLVGEQLLQCKSTVFDLWHSFKAGQIQREEPLVCLCESVACRLFNTVCLGRFC